MDYNFIYKDLKKTSVENLTTAQINEMRDFILNVTSQVETSFTFENILKRLLDSCPDNLDKRTGAIIYDALAPASGELAQLYIVMEIFKEQVYLLTAVGENLDKKGEDFGIIRDKATKAKRIGELKDNEDNFIDLPIGYRFSIPESNATITYKIIDYQSTGKPILECEQTGTAGNDYFGDILPLFNINNLKSASIVGTLEPAQNEEDDDTYRNRILARLNYKPFGGNIQDYIQLVEDEIDGASTPQVYPVWDGGGTVKLSIIDTEYKPITEEFKQQIKEKIDPEQYTGQGVGLAPIDHKVTIDTPEKYVVNISCNLELEENVEVSQIKDLAIKSLENYFDSVRKEWASKQGDEYYLRILIARITQAILNVPQIINITELKLNNDTLDLKIDSNAQKQQIPYLGTITFNGKNITYPIAKADTAKVDGSIVE